MSTDIALHAVTHRFGPQRLALDRVSFDVAAGSFVALLGPSGCGKTTLLRMVAGLDAPSEGMLRVGAAGRPPPVRSYVFQDATLMPWASVFDNVWLPLRIGGLGREAARARIAPLLAALGLQDHAQALPAELSGGLRMRASIARALVTRPDLLLMDEPFAALDEITRQRLNDALLALWQAQGFTVLFVTHSVYEAVFLAQRVLVMSAAPGRIVADLAVDAGGPRTREWRLDPRYLALCAEASAALESGYGAPAGSSVAGQ